MKVVVLGAGLVGAAMIEDLAADVQVTAVDVDQSNLNRLQNKPAVKIQKADLSDSSTVTRLIKDHDLVIGSLPGSMGFRTLRTVIEAGKKVVDISFFPEDPFQLDELAKEKGVTVVVDCGVAPGCSNLILGHMTTVLDETDAFECYVGGLPRVRTWPYEYKAPFSPSDVLEEYTRPARMVENGRQVTKPALSEIELLDFSGVGTLEAFNTDGLRTLLMTMKIPFMKEKTMRYPGHAERMRMLRETGFFAKEPVQIKESEVRPLDLTSALLFGMWKLNQGEEDFTVMRIVVKGKKKGKARHFVFDMLDRYDGETQTTSMARTTGYTCTTVARLMMEGKINRTGICPPEFIGQDEECYRYVMNGLKRKKVDFKETVTEFD